MQQPEKENKPLSLDDLLAAVSGSPSPSSEPEGAALEVGSGKGSLGEVVSGKRETGKDLLSKGSASSFQVEPAHKEEGLSSLWAELGLASDFGQAEGGARHEATGSQPKEETRKTSASFLDDLLVSLSGVSESEPAQAASDKTAAGRELAEKRDSAAKQELAAEPSELQVEPEPEFSFDSLFEENWLFGDDLLAEDLLADEAPAEEPRSVRSRFADYGKPASERLAQSVVADEVSHQEALAEEGFAPESQLEDGLYAASGFEAQFDQQPEDDLEEAPAAEPGSDEVPAAEPAQGSHVEADVQVEGALQAERPLPAEQAPELQPQAGACSGSEVDSASERGLEGVPAVEPKPEAAVAVAPEAEPEPADEPGHGAPAEAAIPQPEAQAADAPLHAAAPQAAPAEQPAPESERRVAPTPEPQAAPALQMRPVSAPEPRAAVASKPQVQPAPKAQAASAPKPQAAPVAQAQLSSNPHQKPSPRKPAKAQESAKPQKKEGSGFKTAGILLVVAAVVCGVVAVCLLSGGVQPPSAASDAAQASGSQQSGASHKVDADPQTYEYSIDGLGGESYKVTEVATFDEEGYLQQSEITILVPDQEAGEKVFDQLKGDFGNLLLDGKASGQKVVLVVGSSEKIDSATYAQLMKEIAK